VIFYLLSAPRVFFAMIAQAWLRGDDRNITERISTGKANINPTTGIIIIPIKVNIMPISIKITPTVLLDTGSNLQSVFFILSPPIFLRQLRSEEDTKLSFSRLVMV
jgi:hypothetical protein